MKLCYPIDKYGTVEEKMTFRSFHDTERLLNTYEFFKLKDGKTVNREFPLPWKRSFAYGKTLIKKIKTTIEDFISKLNELKRRSPNDFG